MHAFIKRLFEYKEAKMLQKVMPLKLWCLCLFGACNEAWAAPGAQTLPLRYRGWQFWCSPMVCAHWGHSSFNLCPRTPPKPSQKSRWEDAVSQRSSSGGTFPAHPLWPARLTGPRSICSHSPLPRAPLLHGNLPPAPEQPGSRIANIFRNDPVAAMYYKWNKCTII